MTELKSRMREIDVCYGPCLLMLILQRVRKMSLTFYDTSASSEKNIESKELFKNVWW
jgi:hypothetical protein